jgi:decaprenyl-phosphate phosphoribosyltransferase
MAPLRRISYGLQIGSPGQADGNLERGMRAKTAAPAGSSRRPDCAMSMTRSVAPYIKIARLDHWVKNAFMLPGAALAYMLFPSISVDLVVRVLIGLLSTGFIASANYTINEYLDAEFDKLHPLKRERPAARGNIKGRFVGVQYVGLAAAGFATASLIGSYFLACSAALFLMGIIYNVRPFRTKDRAILDVISESVNNPSRFLLGWFCVTSVAFPPSSALLSYWAGGAFLMTMKRYAEYRQIGDPALAGSYRRSFAFYTERSLLVMAFFYALNSTFFLGIFLIKYRIEFVLLFPFLSLLFVEYFLMSMGDGSTAYAPEKLYKERRLMSILAANLIMTLVLLWVKLPFLDFLLQKIDLKPH